MTTVLILDDNSEKGAQIMSTIGICLDREQSQIVFFLFFLPSNKYHDNDQHALIKENTMNCFL